MGVKRDFSDVEEDGTPKSNRKVKKSKKLNRDLSDPDLNMSDIQGENSHILIKDLSVISQISPMGKQFKSKQKGHRLDKSYSDQEESKFELSISKRTIISNLVESTTKKRP